MNMGEETRDCSHADVKERWKDIAGSLFRLGVTSYGGPAIMGIMQAELQERRQWVSKERFVEGPLRGEHAAGRDGDSTRYLPGVCARGVVGRADWGTLLRGARVRHHARPHDGVRHAGRHTDCPRRSIRAGPGRARPVRGRGLSPRPVRGKHRAGGGHRCGGGGRFGRDVAGDRGHSGPGRLCWASASFNPGSRENRWSMLSVGTVPCRARNGVVAERVGSRLGGVGARPESEQPAGYRGVLPQGRRVHHWRRPDNDRLHPGPGCRAVWLADAARIHRWTGARAAHTGVRAHDRGIRRLQGSGRGGRCGGRYRGISSRPSSSC